MRYLFVFAIILFIGGKVAGQTSVTGVCVDSLGNRIEYVNVGVMDSNWGTMSDAHGHFSLNIPDSLLEKTFTFSHISFKKYTVTAGELIQKYSEVKTEGKDFKVVLNDNSFALDQVVVTSSKLSRVKNLNSKGIIMPLVAFVIYSRPSYIKDPESAKKREEAGIALGVLLDLDKETWIREIELNYLESTFDTLILRIAVYSMDTDTITKVYKKSNLIKKWQGNLTPLMKSPHYINMPKGEKQKIHIDISDHGIITTGSVYVSIESVEIKGKGSVYSHAFTGASGIFINPKGEEYMMVNGFGFGLQIKGSVIR